jgi:hypothetical protein
MNADQFPGQNKATLQRSTAGAAELKKQWIDYKDGEKPLYGYLVCDHAVSGKRPGVPLAHSRAGMSETTFGIPT